MSEQTTNSLINLIFYFFGCWAGSCLLGPAFFGMGAYSILRGIERAGYIYKNGKVYPTSMFKRNTPSTQPTSKPDNRPEDKHE